jgi:hypothetical protein
MIPMIAKIQMIKPIPPLVLPVTDVCPFKRYAKRTVGARKRPIKAFGRDSAPLMILALLVGILGLLVELIGTEIQCGPCGLVDRRLPARIPGLAGGSLGAALASGTPLRSLPA